jgi:DNA-binding GntR family transcriptional regulator
MAANHTDTPAPERRLRPRETEDLIAPTRAGAVLARLRTMIQDGTLAPGERLFQKELGERFGVSTTPIREAFNSLAREGYIRYSPHQGAVVFDPSMEELEELTNIRIALEGLATEIACPNLDEEELSELEAIVKQMGQAKALEDSKWLNKQFHTIIYEAASQPRLLEMITPLREASVAYQNRWVQDFQVPYREEAQQEHEAIVAALRARDARKAADLLRAHLDHYRCHLAEVFDRAQ